MPRKCYVDFLGCEKRKLDSQRILNYLEINGYVRSANIEAADLIVLVTCAFYQKYEDWSIAKLEKIYRRKKSGSRVVVGGCLGAINPERLLPFADLVVISVRELERLDDLIEATVPMRAIADPNITIFDNSRHGRYHSQRLKTSAQNDYEQAKKGFKIRIGWGCLGQCSYCVTRHAVGILASKPSELIVDEFQRGLATGHRSFFFTAGDTGAYGQDIGSSIAELLDILLAIAGDYQIHFHDFGPHWLSHYSSQIIPILAGANARIGCFSLPVQSGSDKILRLMRRPYTQQQAQSLFSNLRQNVPQMKIGTHFIVGFPGETDADFAESLKLVQRFRFDFLNVFPYTDHALSDSRHYLEKVPKEIAQQRYYRLFSTFESQWLGCNPIISDI